MSYLKGQDCGERVARWYESLPEAGFGHRILPVAIAVALESGRMAASMHMPTIAGLMAVTAKVNGLALVINGGPKVEGVQYMNRFNVKG
jgi:hypothetical protein